MCLRVNNSNHKEHQPVVRVLAAMPIRNLDQPLGENTATVKEEQLIVTDEEKRQEFSWLIAGGAGGVQSLPHYAKNYNEKF